MTRDRSVEQNAMNNQHVDERLSGYLDGELTQQEAQRIEAHLARCEHCQREFEQLIDLKQQLGQLRYPQPEEEWLKQVVHTERARNVTWIGWLALAVGCLLILVWDLKQIVFATDVPLIIKVAVLLCGGGGLILFGVVARQRFKIYKTDKYRSVDL